MLEEERQADNTLRSQFKEKWNRSESDKLTVSIKNNLDTYRQMISTAMNADSVSVPQSFSTFFILKYRFHFCGIMSNLLLVLYCRPFEKNTILIKERWIFSLLEQQK